jgi:exodeoxyribonuclease-5
MISNSSNDGSVFGSGKLLEDLVEYVYSGTDCRLILVGDNAQLPPVGSVLSRLSIRMPLRNLDLD